MDRARARARARAHYDASRRYAHDDPARSGAHMRRAVHYMRFGNDEPEAEAECKLTYKKFLSHMEAIEQSIATHDATDAEAIRINNLDKKTRRAMEEHKTLIEKAKQNVEFHRGGHQNLKDSFTALFCKRVNEAVSEFEMEHMKLDDHTKVAYKSLLRRHPSLQLDIRENVDATMARLAELSASSKQAATTADRTRIRTKFSKMAKIALSAITVREKAWVVRPRDESDEDDLASSMDSMMIDSDIRGPPKEYKRRKTPLPGSPKKGRVLEV